MSYLPIAMIKFISFSYSFIYNFYVIGIVNIQDESYIKIKRNSYIFIYICFLFFFFYVFDMIYTYEKNTNKMK
jgi:hypothetical protein